MQSPLYMRAEEYSAVLRPRLVKLRRDFYMHPELSGEEQRTAQVVADRLRALGLTVQTGVGGYGVVGVLQGAHPGPIVAYRADMDAMPVQDTLETDYCSPILGVKHACGHDVHMAVALGVAETLVALRDELTGTVRFIFQPAEESMEGARAMLAEDVLGAPAPEAIFALHAFPIPIRTVGLATGTCLAGMEEFIVRFHGAPNNLDVAMTRATSVLRTHVTAPPTNMAAFDALVGAMRAGEVPEGEILVSCWPLVDFPGLGDCLLVLASFASGAAQDAVRTRIRAVLDSVAAETGTTYDLTSTFGNPLLVNDAAIVRGVLPLLEATVGPENVWLFHSLYPYAHEDFALYLDHVPGALLWLGIANPEKGITSLLHASDFDVDEDALVIGVQVITRILLHFLVQKSHDTPL
ncbi:MAG: amidohydrolase [Anaerolineae bacterium]|nr:amidohydrolase [Anaerolineae bacterium]